MKSTVTSKSFSVVTMLAILLSVCLVNSFLYAQLVMPYEPPPAQPVQPQMPTMPTAPTKSTKDLKDGSKKINFNVKTYKDTFVIGEPVTLRFEIKNLTKDKFNFSSNITYTQDLHIFIQSGNQQPLPYIGYYKPESKYVGASTEMVPGVVYSWENVIYHDANEPSGLVFDTPGEYTVIVAMKGEIDYKEKVILKPSPVKVKIVKPVGINAQALPMIEKPECSAAITMLKADDKTAPIFENLLKKYPKSIYAPYAAYSFVEYRAPKNAKTKGDVLRKAIAGYEDFLKKYPKSQISDGAIYNIALYYLYLNDFDNATKWLAKFKKEFPNSTRDTGNDKLAQKIIMKKTKLENEKKEKAKAKAPAAPSVPVMPPFKAPKK